jgi:hypothetical protein
VTREGFEQSTKFMGLYKLNEMINDVEVGYYRGPIEIKDAREEEFCGFLKLLLHP